ncbi:MAG TPA: ribosome biogenesis factor YjgA [Steroidobacteraceae bacterium]|nr:ribosome biogenesis factor YjgA [Steroidobacteraceae bacterium]
MPGMTDEAEDDTDEGPSKSLLKRQSHDLQTLGEALIELPQNELDAVPLPEILRDAVELARRITAHGGLSRQKQYIGKLMRKVDPEPIRAAIDARRERDRVSVRQFQSLERWRARLIDESASLQEFIDLYPSADRALLSRLIAQAQHEQSQKKPPKAARELFGVIESIVKKIGGE